MKKTLDFNKLAKAQRARKSWEQLQEEKEVDKSKLATNPDSSPRLPKSKSAIRKSS